jgi:IS1 family transposase
LVPTSEAANAVRVAPSDVLADRIVAHPPEKGKGLVANVLPEEKRLRVLAALVDGNSERAVERMTEVNRETVGRFARLLGLGAERLQDRIARDLSFSLVQIDEIWSFVQKKQSRVTETDPPDFGEAYTFAAIDTSSRFVISWLVGRRDQETADAFIEDLRARLVVAPQITTDGFVPYVAAVGQSFGPGVDYMQTVKNYTRGGRRDDDHRYEPPRPEAGRPFITKTTIYGAPDPKRASTAYVERLNGTTRSMVGRMRRLCYAFSKRRENLRAAVALCYVHYNFCRVHRTLRVTPAMAAGVTDHVWELPELMAALLSAAPVEPPRAKPLAFREPEAPSRALPEGRGYLRVVTEPTPALRGATPRHDPPQPPVAPAAPQATTPRAPLAPVPAPKPAPRRPMQLSLFDPPPPKSSQ